ncbi:Zn(2)-C7 fungal-type transcription factor [Pseudohyphozyma bogoriensis]|nr:Zn(2)-C7 fungal-type transcription factor [Pseudohyphozyma bogoriensis]
METGGELEWYLRQAIAGPSSLPIPDDSFNWLLPNTAGFGTGDLLVSPTPAEAPPVPPTASKSKSKSDAAAGKARPCAPCRMRRVKCLREDGIEVCIQCTKKGIACTAMPPRAKRTIKRTGPLIEQAKAAFAYLAFNSGKSILVAELDFQQQFELAGRQVHSMDPQYQVLCFSLVALSSHHSDHPFIIGSSAPKMAELSQASLEGRDLQKWGLARTGACTTLVRKALESVDDQKALRTPSMSTIASLMILEDLVDDGDPSRPSYVAAYVAHGRQLLGKAKPTYRRFEGSAMLWTAYVRDAVMSAVHGHSPSFSEDDLMALCNGPRADFWQLFNSFLMEVADLGTLVALRLTGVRARRAPRMDEAALQEVLERLERARLAALELESRRHRYDLRPDLHAKNSRKYSFTARVLRCFLCYLLHDLIEDRLEERTRPVDPNATGLFEMESPPENEHQAYWANLEGFKTASKTTCFMASLEIASIIEVTICAGVSTGQAEWIDEKVSRWVFAEIPKWTQYLLSTPSTEEGGPVGYNFIKKLEVFGWIQRALRSYSWSRDVLETSMFLQETIAFIEQQQTQYWSNIVSTLATDLSMDHPVDQPTSSVFSDEDLQTLLGGSAMMM